MALTSKDYDPQSAATRLHRLEDVVKTLQVPQGFDLTSFVSSFNRLYTMTMKGAVAFPDEPITWDLPDNQFFFSAADLNTSLTILMLGGGGGVANFALTQKPMANRILGGDEYGHRTEVNSLLQMTFGNQAYFFEPTHISFADVVLGSPTYVEQVLNGPDSPSGTVLGYIKHLEAEIDYLKVRISSLESRI